MPLKIFIPALFFCPLPRMISSSGVVTFVCLTELALVATGTGVSAWHSATPRCSCCETVLAKATVPADASAHRSRAGETEEDVERAP